MEYTQAECARNLSAALDAVEKYVRHFVRMPESSIPAVCAWIAHTYLIDEDGFPACVTPRLGFTSRKPGGGKSTALGVVVRLSRNGEKFLLPSKAGYMNAIEATHSTICLDEMDKTFPKASSRIDIQAAINAGYEPDGGTIAHGNRKVPMHAFVAFAGIGPVLECNEGLAPLWDRTVRVEMEPVFGVRITEYDVELHGRDTQYLRRVIGSAMEIATLVYGTGLRALTPPLLENASGRRDQIWRVLRRVGMAASPKWSARIEASCLDMEAGRTGAPPILSQAQRIMGDVRAVTFGESQIGTTELIERLRALPDSPWAFLWPKASSGTARQLASLLEPHGLIPGFVSVSTTFGVVEERGYKLTDHKGCAVCSENAPDTDGAPVSTDVPDAVRMPNEGTDTTDTPAVSITFAPPTPRQHPTGVAVPLFTPPGFE